MRTSISIIATLGAIALVAFLLYKFVSITTGFIIGIAIALALAWLGGYTLHASGIIGNLTAQYNERLENLKRDYERGKASISNGIGNHAEA